MLSISRAISLSSRSLDRDDDFDIRSIIKSDRAFSDPLTILDIGAFERNATERDDYAPLIKEPSYISLGTDDPIITSAII